MEAFSLLKYWRNGGGGGSNGPTTTAAFTPASTTKATTKTIVAAAASPYSSDGEDGPFFDLEFGVPDHDTDTDEQTSEESHENEVKLLHSEDGDETESEEEEVSVDDDEEEEEETELKFSVTSNECADQNAAFSPSDDLFFKGDLVTIEPSTILLNAGEENSKFPVFLVKSATKFRVLLLKLKKSKSANGENPEAAEISGKDEAGIPAPEVVERENQGKMREKLFVKLKVEEETPLVNLFSRENSSKAAKQIAQDPDERKEEVMNKYLKMVKPFYVRVSKRYVEKLKFSGHSGGGPNGFAAAPPPELANVKNSQHKQGNNLQAGLKVVRKHLGKSRSASAAAAAAAATPAKAVSDRRDDSLLQLQDGIQGAILHCKKSFNASREVDSSSILSRSVSDPSYEKSVMMPKFLRVPSSTSAEANKKEIIR